ncbi:MAG: ABC transporter ATP-binding protein [Mycoplasmataceae bacterium]|jgi:ABC-2 type transport system ATP-binding protein|nr:ABC transporter ATP-binding protein [Mycoplasmataceae bacterium]
MGVILKITGYSKSYDGGKSYSVNNLSLELKPGDCFGMIGHNGAGKTTTLKAVVGLLDFQIGEILIDGHDIRTEPIACKTKLAYLPDDPRLPEYMTGIQYLNFIADVYNIDLNERNQLINYYAKLFEIDQKLNLMIGSYSHGMKQKIAVIGALIHRPKLMIMDEPFVGLDPIASMTLKKCISEFCKNGGAVLFSSHVLEVVEKICNLIIIISKGKTLQMGKMDDITKTESLEKTYAKLIQHHEKSK